MSYHISLRHNASNWVIPLCRVSDKCDADFACKQLNRTPPVIGAGIPLRDGYVAEFAPVDDEEGESDETGN